MGKTIRKDRRDVKYKEGQHKGRFVYKCRCTYCTGYNDKKDKIHEREHLNELKQSK